MTKKVVNTDTKKQSLSRKKIVVTIDTPYNRREPLGSQNNKLSLTVPDMALSMKEILQRFSRGQSIPQDKNVYYTDDDLSDFDRMDPFEKLDAAREIREDINRIQNDLQNPPGPSDSKTPPPSPNSTQDAKQSGDKPGE